MLICVQVAPMVDWGMFQLEGMVPWGNKNTYKMPVNVYVFGQPDPAHAEAVKNRLMQARIQIGCWGAASPVHVPGKHMHTPMQRLGLVVTL